MVILDKKERSKELNTIKRELIDFKSLVNDDTFILYKSGGLTYYIFDNRGFFMIRKRSKFLALEKFLEENEYISINYSELKSIVGLKKSEVNDIRYDTDTYTIETDKDDDEIDHYTITKEKHFEPGTGVLSLDLNELKTIVDATSNETLERDFIEATYDFDKQMLFSKTDNLACPYKITFSDDINVHLKIDRSDSQYYIKYLNNGSFVQVITKSVYKKVFDAQSMLFVFNYLNNREA